MRSIRGCGLFGRKTRLVGYYSTDPNRKKLIGNMGQFGIGQRCLLLETENGNVLWDLIALLDDQPIQFVCSPLLTHCLISSQDLKSLRSNRKAASKLSSSLTHTTTPRIRSGLKLSTALFIFPKMTKVGCAGNRPCHWICASSRALRALRWKCFLV